MSPRRDTGVYSRLTTAVLYPEQYAVGVESSIPFATLRRVCWRGSAFEIRGQVDIFVGSGDIILSYSYFKRSPHFLSIIQGRRHNEYRFI